MRNRTFITISALIVLLLTGYLFYFVNFSSEQRESKSIPRHMKVEFIEMKGEMPRSLAYWQGNIILVNFWATWCVPCREEMPELGEIYNKFKGLGVVTVGIALDDSSKISEFIRQGNSIDYPILVADMDGMPYAISLGNKAMAVPYTVLLDRKGNVAHVYYGRIKPVQIEEDISNLLKKS